MNHYAGRVFQKGFTEGPASENQRVESLGIVLQESDVLKYVSIKKYGASNLDPETLKQGDIDLTIIANNPESLLTRIKRVVPDVAMSGKE